MAARIGATLKAWQDCVPEGMTVPESRLESKLPYLSLRVPGGLASPEAAHRLDALFSSIGMTAAGVAVPFLQLLPVRRGLVHFLDFWKAFDLAISSVAGEGFGAMSGMAWELGEFRDRMLAQTSTIWNDCQADASESGGETDDDIVCLPRLAAGQLLDLLENAKAASLLPDFWRRWKREFMEDRMDHQELSLQELGEVMHSWLLDALAPSLLQKRHRHFSPSEKCREVPVVRPEGGTCLPCRPAEDGMPVYLHIYDVSHDRGLRNLNKVFANRLAPVKFGGVFHVGVEVAGVEWSYGWTLGKNATGITGEEPRSNPDHHFRQTISLRTTTLSHEAISQILADLLEEYRGRDYDLLKRNCCHFAEDFTRRLGVRRIPRWVQRMARIGARLDGVLHVAQGLRTRSEQPSVVEGRAALGGA